MVTLYRAALSGAERVLRSPHRCRRGQPPARAPVACGPRARPRDRVPAHPLGARHVRLRHPTGRRRGRGAQWTPPGPAFCPRSSPRGRCSCALRPLLGARPLHPAGRHVRQGGLPGTTSRQGRGAPARHLRRGGRHVRGLSRPLHGVLFTLEEIHKEFTAPLIISVMCSAIVSDLIASQVLGLTPVLALALVRTSRMRATSSWVFSASPAAFSGRFTTAACSSARTSSPAVRSHLPYAAPRGTTLPWRWAAAFPLALAHVRRATP